MVRNNSKFKEIIQHLNHMICFNLVRTRKHPFIKFKIEIDNKFHDFLHTKYNLKGRFVKCDSILKDFALITNNYYNDDDFHQIKKDSFEIKLLKNKNLKAKTKVGSLLKEISVISKPYLSVRFYRINQVSLNDFELNFFNKYRKINKTF
jgi:hypothetical protein